MGLFSSMFGKGIDAYMEDARATPGAVVLDVRSSEEYVDGHIDGARNVPVSHIQNAPRQVPALDTPLFVYCLSGARSAQACRFLTQMGYTTVTNMGGINRWSGPVKQGRI